MDRSENHCCESGMTWVTKHSDLVVPEVEQDGKPNGDSEYVDVNFYRCRFCGGVRAVAA